VRQSDHYSLAYYGEMSEWWAYNAELRQYVGSDAYDIATKRKFKNDNSEPEDEMVTRDTILDFIKKNRK
jgi:hypothetical protein